jgi:hypothetical protein
MNVGSPFSQEIERSLQGRWLINLNNAVIIYNLYKQQQQQEEQQQQEQQQGCSQQYVVQG